MEVALTGLSTDGRGQWLGFFRKADAHGTGHTDTGESGRSRREPRAASASAPSRGAPQALREAEQGFIFWGVGGDPPGCRPLVLEAACAKDRASKNDYLGYGRLPVATGQCFLVALGSCARPAVSRSEAPVPLFGLGRKAVTHGGAMHI